MDSNQNKPKSSWRSFISHGAEEASLEKLRSTSLDLRPAAGFAKTMSGWSESKPARQPMRSRNKSKSVANFHALVDSVRSHYHDVTVTLSGGKSGLLSRARSKSYLPLGTSKPQPTVVSTSGISANVSDLPVKTDPLTGGAAARASAAAENERLAAGRTVVVKKEPKTNSGIGGRITLQCTDAPLNKVVRKDPVQCLPSEIFIQILAHLDHKSLVRAEQVSRDWNRQAASSHTWREVYHREYTEDWHSSSIAASSSNITRTDKIKEKVGQEWKRLFMVRHSLKQRWLAGVPMAWHLEGHSDSVYCLQFDEDKIITGSRDRTIRVWDMRTNRCLRIIGDPSHSSLHTAVMPRSQALGSSSGTIIIEPSSIESPDESFVQAVPDVESPALTSSPGMYHVGSILCLQFDSQILVSGSSDGTSIVYSIEDNYHPIHRLRHHDSAVLAVSFDERHIVSSSKDTTICVWDRTSGQMLRQLLGHEGPVNAMEMRGGRIVSTGGDGIIKVWDLESGNCIQEFDGQWRGLACLHFSENRRWIATGGNDHIGRLWNAATGQCVQQYEGHGNLLRSLHLNDREGRLVSTSYDCTVKVWDLATGNLLIDFLRWTTGIFLCVQADYRRIIASSLDGKVYIMDFGAGLRDVEMLQV